MTAKHDPSAAVRDRKTFIVEGVEIYAMGRFDRATLLDRARFAVGQVERLLLHATAAGVFPNKKINEAQIAILYLAAAISTLENAVIDDEQILREQLVYNTRRLLEESEIHFVEKPK